MYGRSNNLAIILFLLIASPSCMVLALTYTDHIQINIDKSYEGELNTCELENIELEDKLERTKPICPEVQYSLGGSGVIRSFIYGVAITFAVMYNFIKPSTKKKKKTKKKNGKKN